MKEHFMAILHNIPWPFLMIKNLPPEKIRMQRVIEGILISVLSSAITLGIGSYVLIKVLDTKIGFYAQQIHSNSSDIRELRHDLYEPRMRRGDGN